MTTKEKLFQEHSLTKDECMELLQNKDDPELVQSLRDEALKLRHEIYGSDVYMRGLIEFTNICRQDCYYCGIRKSNPEPERYRMKKEEILACCDYGYGLGFRTFVLQGGEDGYYTDEILVPIVEEIKERFPDCALTLSMGERPFDSYKALREAGADRYLLRHETANEKHYRHLHPDDLSLKTRMNCLYDLKSLGFQVGDGFMVGSPYQTMECLADDLVFLQELEPEMVGIGPFIPHHGTSYADHPAGSVDLTLFLISVIRILLPDVLLPATTALSALDPQGWEKGMLAGANVLMPNITPVEMRDLYTLYDKQTNLTSDTEQRIKELTESMEANGFRIVWDRGDHKPNPVNERKPEEPDEIRDREKEAEIRKENIEKKKKKKKKKKEKEKAKAKEKKTKKAQEKEKLKKKNKDKKKKAKEKKAKDKDGKR